MKSNVKKIQYRLRYVELASSVLLLHFIFWLLSKCFYPISGPHSFRQAQTNWPMQIWQNYGFNPLYPKVPIKGSELSTWLLEFPLHQITVYLFNVITNIEIDYLSRIVSFTCATTSILLLSNVIHRRLHINPTISLAIFIFNSYFMYWGTTGLVDWMSIALGIISAAITIRSEKKKITIVFASISLILGTMIKPSHAFMAFLLYIVIESIDNKFSVYLKMLFARGVLFITGIALLFSASWTLYIGKLYDLKDPRSIWSVNPKTYTWYFGSKEQYLNLPQEVTKIFDETLRNSIGLSLFIFISLITLVSARLAFQSFLILITGVVYVSIFINLNLVHTYYQIPVYIFSTVILVFFLGIVKNNFNQVVHFISIFLVVAVLINSWKPSLERQNYFQEVTNRSEPVADCPVFVNQNDWVLTFQIENPYNFYFCGYRSFMVAPERLIDMSSAKQEIAVFKFVYAQNEEQKSLAAKFLSLNGREMSPTGHPSYYRINLID